MYFHLQPQGHLPDVFVWLISGGKRLAYRRIPAREIFYSASEEFRGRNAGRMQTFFLKVFPWGSGVMIGE